MATDPVAVTMKFQGSGSSYRIPHKPWLASLFVCSQWYCIWLALSFSGKMFVFITKVFSKCVHRGRSDNIGKLHPKEKHCVWL